MAAAFEPQTSVRVFGLVVLEAWAEIILRRDESQEGGSICGDGGSRRCWDLNG